MARRHRSRCRAFVILIAALLLPAPLALAQQDSRSVHAEEAQRYAEWRRAFRAWELESLRAVTALKRTEPTVEPLLEAETRLRTALDALPEQQLTPERRAEVYTRLRDLFDGAAAPAVEMLFALLADEASPEADAAIAAFAVFDERPDILHDAQAILLRRAETDGVSDALRDTVRQAIASGVNDRVEAGAAFADALDLYEMIPLLVETQLVIEDAGVYTDSLYLRRPLGRTRHGFVWVRRPYDQYELGVRSIIVDARTDRVHPDSIYLARQAQRVRVRPGVHAALVSLSSRAGDASTARFGYDLELWDNWLRDRWPLVRREIERARLGLDPAP